MEHKNKKEKCTGQPTILQNALLPSEQLETGNKSKDVIVDDGNRASATKEIERNPRKKKKFFTFSLKKNSSSE
jgi:hypothetical protein